MRPPLHYPCHGRGSSRRGGSPTRRPECRGCRDDGATSSRGRRVEIDGEIVGDLDGAGDTAIITGKVDGAVRADAEHLVIEAGARIGGDGSWPAGHTTSIHDGATIAGRRLLVVLSQLPLVRVLVGLAAVLVGLGAPVPRLRGKA